MKGRAVDLALIVGLVLVAGAIVWTLFSLGGGPATPRPGGGTITQGAAGGPGDAPGDAAGPNGGVIPIAPGGDPVPGGTTGAGANVGASADGPAGGASVADGANGAGPATGAADGATDGTTDVGAAAVDATAADGAGTSPGSSDGATPGNRPDPEVPAASAPPVPAAGEVPLGRIGFSFVTGGAGACGIVLEPWTHVAVSRELLSAYGCGAEVTVALDEPKAGRTTVQAVVADTMNEAFSRTVNLYVGEDEPALTYGLTTGTIEPR